MFGRRRMRAVMFGLGRGPDGCWDKWTYGERGEGPFPGGGWGGGWGGPWGGIPGGGRGRGGGRRARRGDAKYLLLELIAEKPRHGYEIIKELEGRAHGWYKPSPGTVYPTLQMLEEGGFLTSAEVEGRKVYTITDAGREMLAEVSRERARERGSEGEGPGPFAAFGWQPPRHLHELRGSIGELIGGAMNVAWHGDADDVRRLREVLERAAREVRDIGKK